MTSVQRNRTTYASRRHVAQGVFAATLAMLGGCSADVTRFDFPAFNLSEGSAPTGSLPSAGSEPASRRGAGTYAGNYDGPRGAGVGEDAGRGYQPQPYRPDPYQTSNQAPSQTGRSQPTPSTTELAPLPERAPPDRSAMRPPERSIERAPVAERRYEAPRATASGETIEVQPGDTLFGLAKRHGVPVGALIEVNGLQNGTAIKPGQRLALPAGARPARTAYEPPAREPAGRPSQPTQTASVDMPGWNGSYTLNQGDSLYAIARQHRVSLADLQRANGITDPTKVRAGTVLKVPGMATGSAETRTVAERTAEPAPSRGEAPANLGPRVVQIPDAGQSRMNSGAPAEPGKVASRGDTATDASPDASPAAKFRWPVTGGRMIGTFGKRPDGTHNDGINMAVPLGTEVRAAEGGRIAYAGSELKGYGNLVLIRHDNGWVTAYAHSEEILVKRDDVVRKGQVIARAGKTGTVDQPQLHFELRQGAKPIDPLPYMERN
jgi:murein DD-endopeptidase MepM/ murein hydrolase activator NlpD